MTPVSGPARSATLSVAEASTDVRGRYGRDCKTVYTGSNPVVASIILSTKTIDLAGDLAIQAALTLRCPPAPVRHQNGGLQREPDL
jgi:hypothetical protein